MTASFQLDGKTIFLFRKMKTFMYGGAASTISFETVITLLMIGSPYWDHFFHDYSKEDRLSNWRGLEAHTDRNHRMTNAQQIVFNAYWKDIRVVVRLGFTS